MTETDLLRAVNGASDQQLSHSERARPGRRLPVLLAAAAACAALLLLLWPRGGTELAPGVTLRYEDPDVSLSAVYELAYFTEEELLFPRQWEQAVFQGQVTSVRNLSLDFNGSKVWRALADIRVSRVWQGDVQAGETVSVLLPCPVAEGVWVEDCQVAARIEAGTEGIFLPIQYGPDAFWEQNSASVQLRDIAPFGLADGMRFAFLDAGDGLIYEASAWPGLEGASSLEDVAAFLDRRLAARP